MLKIKMNFFFPIILFFILIGRFKYFCFVNLQEILIKKPYEKVCDEIVATAPPELIDQLSLQCPLAYKTSSRKTGCQCDLSNQMVNCIYSDRLTRPPALFPLEQTNSNLTEWNLDLRCKNFSHLTSLKYFLNLKQINLLDLSGNTSHCKLSDESPLLNTSLVYLTKIGGMNEIISIKPLKKPEETLSINELNLESNKINLFDLQSQQDVYQFQLKIKNLRLAHNRIDSIFIRSQLDICGLGLESLDLSYNQIQKIEIGYLIFLNKLNISSNSLTSFLIDFYDTKEFQAYYSDYCRLETNLVANVLYSNLVELDFSYNFLANLPFPFLNIKFLNLVLLNLNSNRVRILNAHEFQHMKNLNSLNLKSNLIEQISDKALHGLSKLLVLDLSFNFISRIPHQFFADQNTSLETLCLNQNQLAQIPKESFRHLTHVKYLYLNRNRIQALGNYSFGYMKNLIELYLAENQINTIEINAFNIDPMSFLGPGLIEKIDLSYNRLGHLNASIFFYLTNLRYLILNNNQLKHIDKVSFTGVNYLISLDLSLNQIEELNFCLIKISLI